MDNVEYKKPNKIFRIKNQSLVTNLYSIITISIRLGLKLGESFAQH